MHGDVGSIPGFRNPVHHSYEIVRESVRLTRKRTEGMAVQVRPWLQDFKDYAFDKRIFGVSEMTRVKARPIRPPAPATINRMSAMAAPLYAL